MEPPKSWERVWVPDGFNGKTKPEYKYIPKAGDDREYPASFGHPVPIAPLTPVPAVATDEP